MLRFPAVVYLFLGAVCAWAQSAQPVATSDAQAVSLAQHAFVALTGGTSISDVTLSATVSSSAGSVPDTGTATFYAKGLNESRIDLTLSASSRTDIRSGSSIVPQGAWSANSGNSTKYAGQNCWSDASWFFPALGSLSTSDPSIVLKYVGLETRNGTSVQHIQSYRNASPQAFVQQWSTTDFWLDASSSLPVALSFNSYFDNNITVTLPVEIDFSNYQSVNSALVPMHIQRYVQGALVLDAVVTSVRINSGLADSEFTIQ